jgi:hypothetical protein
MATETQTTMGGKVRLYRRGDSDHWHCSIFLNGKMHRKGTRQDSLALAKEVAEDWYLTLRGKQRAGLLKTEKTFADAANQFEKGYHVITEGQRSPRWVEGHKIRLRLHLRPFLVNWAFQKSHPARRRTTACTAPPRHRSEASDRLD